MNTPVFSREDFRLCFVPVPEGYPQSQTHAGVYEYDGKLFLTTSPYPLIKRPQWIEYLRVILRKMHLGFLVKRIDAEYYENPLLYIAKAGDATSFVLMQNQPLMSPPVHYFGLPAYNSDPDLFIEDGVFFVLNRSYFRKRLENNQIGCEVRLYLIKGLLDNCKFKYWGTQLIKIWDKPTIVSPCLTHYDGAYYLLYLDTNSALDWKSFNGLYYYKSKEINGLSKSSDRCEIQVNGDGIFPWHISVFQHHGRLFSIVTCAVKGEEGKLWQLFGEFSDDLSQMKIYQTPLTDYNSYRGSAYVDSEGIFHLYSTTLRERIIESKSVDGRDVIHASMSFQHLYCILRKNEKCNS